MVELPTGVVTLLFTDIEGSTRLWERHPGAMPAAIDRHDTILRTAIESGGGVVFRTVGDAFFAAFAAALAALQAALYAQRALHAEPWGEIGSLRVRMALHTSAVEMRGLDYFGPPLNRVARLLSAGHGGQTLLGRATYEQVRDSLPPGVTLLDLAEHRLRDLAQPEHIFQLAAAELPADFPPLKTLTLAAPQPPNTPTFRQSKLPGMPGVDYDALWRTEKARERRRKARKGKAKQDKGLF